MLCALDTGAIWLVDTQSHLHIVLPENKVSGVEKGRQTRHPSREDVDLGARPQPFKDGVTDRSFLALVEESWSHYKNFPNIVIRAVHSQRETTLQICSEVSLFST